MALHEAPLSCAADEGQLPSQDSRVRYGFAFLDAAAGRFYVGAADDDAGRATLGALLTQVWPAGFLIRRSTLGAAHAGVGCWCTHHGQSTAQLHA